MIYYIIQSSVCLILLLGIYMLLLKTERAFIFNRFYLIFSVILSLSVPALQLESTNSVIKPLTLILNASEIENAKELSSINFQEPIGQSSNSFPWLNYILVIYVLLTGLFFSKYVVNLIRLKNLADNKGPIINSLQTVLLNSPIKPFSFFKFLFVHQDELEAIKQNDALIYHEKAHAQQFHSLDILGIELVKCLLWFNPIVWIYKKEITENHEYLADSYAVKKQNDIEKYALNLIASAAEKSSFPLSSGFSYVLISKRIKMLKQPNTKSMSNIMKITSGAILAISIIAISAFNLENSPVKLAEKEIRTLVKNAPAMLPIKKDQIIKISSGFGLRVHPINKMKKMHNGVDFITKEGTAILATADGTVTTSNFSNGYGNHIIIKHDDTFETQYAHMSSLNVKEGDHVKAGQTIGVIGNSGQSLAIHLHYEVIKDGVHVNPADFFEFE